MSDALSIRRVEDKRALGLFIEIAYQINGVETLWVPPLRRDVMTLLDRGRHPFHKHAVVEYFLAYRGSQCVGRVAAIENQAHNEFHGEKIGFFGFLDARPEQEVFNLLLGAVADWARKRGLTALRGPCSFSTNEECGALVLGFEVPPCLMMPWNPESYPRLIEGAGYTKAKDLYSYWVTEHTYDDRMDRVADRLRRKLAEKGGKVVSRGLDMSRFAEELERVRTVYNKAWEKNWGFVPMTREEIEHMARELKPVLRPEILRFIEIDGEPIGFALTMPDYNIVSRHMEGKLGLKQMALFLMLKNLIKQIRVMTVGVVEEYRNRGLESLLISDSVRECRKFGYTSADLGWILEDNVLMNRALVAIGGRHYKTHRIFQKDLS